MKTIRVTGGRLTNWDEGRRGQKEMNSYAERKRYNLLKNKVAEMKRYQH